MQKRADKYEMSLNRFIVEETRKQEERKELYKEIAWSVACAIVGIVFAYMLMLIA